MNADELNRLADRCEAATGPDRDINIALLPLVGIRFADEGRPIGQVCYDQHHHAVPMPRFTASLDAAMTLVPEGWNWGVGPVAEWISRPRPWAWCDETGEDWDDSWNCYASTPALALTAACLRAIAAQPEQPDSRG